ncbi:MAG: hypothetical protein EPN93_01540 [Spirochaetes bacterium]|nr:MAG: hypothetical protein EPN93_01540 [Spirochaetota bacterium]
MRRPYGIWVALILLLFIGYAYFTAVIKIAPDEYAVSENQQNGECLLLAPGYNFLPHALIPGRVSLTRFPCRVSELVEIRLPIPPLDELNSEYYSIRMPITLAVEADPARLLVDPVRLVKDRHAVIALCKRALEGFFMKEFSPYLAPDFNRDALIAAMDAMFKSAHEKLAVYAERQGLRIIALDRSGALIVPGYGTYYEGLRYLDELRVLEKNNRKEMIALNAGLEREKLARKEFIEKLSEIARLIKSNPDLLKYIYIDRLGDNVKVIIAPEKSGMPLGLGLEQPAEKEPRKTEVDNLR